MLTLRGTHGNVSTGGGNDLVNLDANNFFSLTPDIGTLNGGTGTDTLNIRVVYPDQVKVINVDANTKTLQFKNIDGTFKNITVHNFEAINVSEVAPVAIPR
ncbi:MAG: hypothetical protein VKJ06_04340 [Vampirovibrionales bacterium]|nr:hypothetical protein [Vampirovibrionales bacterium]